METLLQDLRYGVRVLVKKPGFTLLAVLTLALGIGANTAIFSVVNAVLLRPLPFKDPDRIVALWETVPEKGHSRWRVAPANYFDWRDQNNLFEEVATFGAAGLSLTGDGAPEQLLGSRVSANYFSVLGVEPVLGRAFLPEENEPGRERVVILGHDLWQRRFGGDREVIGQTIKLDGNSYTVVGVMPQGIYPTWPLTSAKIVFQASHQQFWIPMPLGGEWRANRTTHVLGVLARLKPQATIKQAQADMDAVARRLEQQHPANKGEGILVSPLMDEVAGSIKAALLILLGTVGFVLLIACANVANLLMARFASRQKEIAIRSALGAGRGRLVRQFLLEGLLLAVLGGAAGIWLAVFGVEMILKIIPRQIPRLDQVSVDWSVLAFTLGVSLASSMVFGLVPALHYSRVNLLNTLKEGGRGSGPGAGGRHFRRLLVVAQVSLAFILIVGAGLLIKSFWRLQRVDPGFNPDRVLTLGLALPPSRYGEWHQVMAFYERLLQRIEQLPGARSVAIAYDHPLEASWINSFGIEGRVEQEQPSGRFCPVSPGYFRTAGIELIRGRQFTEQDDPNHPGAVIINETLARSYFPAEDPLGKRLRIDPPSMMWGSVMPSSFEIVGIVRDVKFLGLDAETEPGFYVPARQSPLTAMTVLVRTEGDPLAMVPALRSEVWALDADQPISDISTMETILAGSIAQPRFNMILMGLFGAVALILATVGIYGLLSFTVAQRTHEIGIRVALGAKPSDVLRLVVGQGLLLALAGIATGLAASLALANLLSSLLFGVTANDPLTFVSMPLLLAAVAALASYIPARRAIRVDPMEALRCE